MATEAAAAYVALYTQMPGAGRDISKALNGSDVKSAVSGAGKGIGSSLLSGLGSIVKAGAVTIGAGVAATLGTALVKGFSRLKSIDMATAKLNGLGNSAEDVEAIMKNALGAVRGTAFGMDAAATVAASTVAAGVKPGEDLQRTLSLVADAATIAGTDMSSMGSIFNKVATSNKLQGDSIAQLSDTGIPIVQFLAKQLGVTGEEVVKLASQGKISFAQFQDAMAEGLGGAAQSSGDTFTGAVANTIASLGRIGAGLLGGLFPRIAPLFQAITTALGPIEGMASGIGESIGTFLGPWVDKLTVWIAGLDASKITEFFSSFKLPSAAEGTDGALASIGSSLRELGPAFSAFGAELPAVGGALSTLASAGLSTVTTILGFLADNVDTIIQFMPLIVAGFIAWRAASVLSAAATFNLRRAELAMVPVIFANNVMRLTSITIEGRAAKSKLAAAAATNAGTTATTRSTASLLRQKVATVASTVATKAAAAGQWLLNAAMSANPITLIVIAIAALVAGLVWFFTQTELGQEIWANFTRFLGEAWDNATAWIKSAFDATVRFLSEAWTNLSLVFQAVWLGFIKPVFDGIAAVFTWIYENIVIPIIVGIVLYFQILGGIFTWIWESVIQPTFRLIGDIFTWILEAVITPIVAGIVATMQTWAAIFTWLYENVIKPVFEGVGAAFAWIYENIIRPYVEWIVGLVVTIGTAISDTFSGIGEFIGGAFQNAFDLARVPLNALIGLINSVIDKLNSISVDIPDWVPMLGGQKFSLNIPRIPQLAEGGVVSRRPGGILANIGEGRYDEAVIPLSPKVLSALAAPAVTTASGHNVQIDVHPSDGPSAEAVGQSVRAQFAFEMGAYT